MSVAKDIVAILAEVLVPLIELIKALDDSSSEEELRKSLDEYKRNKPSIRKDLQALINKYGK